MKTLSVILLFLNPLLGFLSIPLVCYGLWYLASLPIGLVILNLRFYLRTHRDEHAVYDKIMAELRKTHVFLGTDFYNMSELWRNKETDEIIEL